MKDGFNPQGIFKVQHIRDGQVLNEFEVPNTVMTVGKNSALDVIFRAQTQITTWYLGLIDSAGFSSINAANTMSDHATWSEWTNYSEGTRQQWTPSAAASGSITNSSAATFSINASGTLRGLFLVSDNTKGGTSGVLWAATTFSSTVAVVNGDSIKLTYTVNT